MRACIVAIALAEALLAAGSARADTMTQTVRAAMSQPTPLIIENGVRPDCSIGEVPESRVIAEPRHGVLRVGEGQLRRHGANCPPSLGYVVLYVPEANYTGQDQVTIEVVDADGPTLRVFEITVDAGPDPETGLRS